MADQVTVVESNGVFHIMDGGEPAMHNRNRVDGGGFRDRGAAEKLAQDINTRRAAYSGTPVNQPEPKAADEPVPPAQPHYGGMPINPPQPGVEPVSEGAPLVDQGPNPHYGGMPLAAGEVPPEPPGVFAPAAPSTLTEPPAEEVKPAPDYDTDETPPEDETPKPTDDDDEPPPSRRRKSAA